jgi:hypothetical protein
MVAAYGTAVTVRTRWNKALDAGGLVLGEDVNVTIDIELIKQ